MRMVIPFPFEKQGKLLSTKFGWRLILLWPFSETNAAAMCTLKTQESLPKSRENQIRSSSELNVGMFVANHRLMETAKTKSS
jgi:hypothetical protein